MITLVTRPTVRQTGIRQRSLGPRCRMGRATELVFILATGVTLALGSGAEAQAVWEGGTSTDFTDSANYDFGADPTNADVTVDDAAAPFQPTLAGNLTINSGQVSNGTLTIGGTLTATTGVTVTASGTVNVSVGGSIVGALLGGGGDATNDGTISAVTSNFGNFTNNGAVTGQMQTNGGTVVLSAGSTVGSLNNISGTTDISGGVTGAAEVSGGTATLNAGGDIGGAVTVSGTGTLTVTATDTVAGVTQSGGTIEGAALLTTTTFGQTGGDLAGFVSASGAKTLSGGTISGSLEGAGATTVQTGITTVTGVIEGNVTVGAGGTLRLDSVSAVLGSITTTGSVVSYADLMNEDSALIISSATTDLEVLGTDAATQSGIISSTGAFGFEKIGTGNLTVSRVNTYTGLTDVSAGTLTVSNAAGLGATGVGNGTEVDAGATLALTGVLTTGEAITLNGTGVGNGGALRNVSGNKTTSGLITLATNARINSDAGILSINGGITGTNTNLTVGGTGSTAVFSDITTGTGSLTVDATTATGILSRHEYIHRRHNREQRLPATGERQRAGRRRGADHQRAGHGAGCQRRNRRRTVGQRHDLPANGGRAGGGWRIRNHDVLGCHRGIRRCRCLYQSGRGHADLVGGEHLYRHNHGERGRAERHRLGRLAVERGELHRHAAGGRHFARQLRDGDAERHRHLGRGRRP
jgi:hypothetical protein